ncbi:MAG: YbaK/EbsC family protein [Alphaproteobacteria bacterium]
MRGTSEISALFRDCDTGAIPPVGAACGLKVVVDENLEGHEDIYFEGGDHRALVHLSGAEFHQLMGKTRHERFSV